MGLWGIGPKAPTRNISKSRLLFPRLGSHLTPRGPPRPCRRVLVRPTCSLSSFFSFSLFSSFSSFSSFLHFLPFLPFLSVSPFFSFSFSNSLLFPVIITPRYVPPVNPIRFKLVDSLDCTFPDFVKLITDPICCTRYYDFCVFA